MELPHSKQEDLVQKAISEYEDGNFSSARAAANYFGVKPRRVQRRLWGQASYSTRNPSHTRLTSAQEQSLCDYIERLDNIEQSIRLKHIRGAAEYILRTASDPRSPPPPLGKDWVTRFLKRHPKYLKRKQKPLSAKRKNAHDEESIRDAYEKFQHGVQEKGIQVHDTYNMDETGFRIGCGIAHCVVTLDKSKPLRLVDPDNRDYVTSVECVCAADWSLPPFIILKGAHILHKWGRNDLPEDTVLAVSPTGYSNDRLAYDWLLHFDTYSSRRQRGVWRAIILDGFGSHYTYKFHSFAQQMRIDLFVLPPHSTHLTQPLDVGCFQPFKHYHAEAVDAAVRLGSSNFDRLDFLAAFNWIRSQTFTTSTITLAFKKTGFVPYNPEVVLEKVRNLPRAATPPPDSQHPPVLAVTPHSAKDVIKYGEWFQELLAKQAFVIPEGMRKPLAQFVKGSIANGYSRQIAKQDLEAIHKAAVVKRARKTLAGTVAQKGGWMSVSQIRKSLSIVEESAKEKAERALKRATRAEEIQQEKADKAVKATIRRLDHGVWKLVHAHWSVFLGVRSVGRDICKLREEE